MAQTYRCTNWISLLTHQEVLVPSNYSEMNFLIKYYLDTHVSSYVYMSVHIRNFLELFIQFQFISMALNISKSVHKNPSSYDMGEQPILVCEIQKDK